MATKLDALRRGEPVEFEKGVFGRLNQKNKTLQLSTGEVINVGDDPDYFPENEKSVALSQHRELIEKGIKESPFGEFGHQFKTQGLVGSARDLYNFSTLGEDYVNRKQAEQQVSQRISKESPLTSLAATGTSLIPDLLLTRGMSAMKAAPLITAASSGSRLFTDPGEVVKEAAFAAGAGKVLDVGANWLNRAAQRRAQVRAFPAAQQAVREQNIQGAQATQQANREGMQQYRQQAATIKTQNQQKLAQHESLLEKRRNEMLQAKNDEKAFRIAQKQYQQELKKQPSLQKKAQDDYSKSVIKNVEKIEGSFPKDSRFASDRLKTDYFIDETIRKSGFGGTPAASRATKIIKSIFPEGDLLTAKELSNRYRALEDSIKNSSSEVQSILSQYKTHLGTRLPKVIEDLTAYEKIIPSLKKNLEKDVDKIISGMNLAGKGEKAHSEVLRRIAKVNVKNYLKNPSNSNNFVDKIYSGEFADEIVNQILKVEDFGNLSPANINSLRKSGLLEQVLQEAQRRHSYFSSELKNHLHKNLIKAENAALKEAKQASQKFSRKVKNTYGIAPPIASPTAPIAPNIPATPQIPPKPQLTPLPTQPTPQVFNPAPEPNLAPPSGFTERTADLLEANPLGGRGLINNPVTKLAGLKYLLGKAALPLEAGYLGMRGLTSPTAAGQAARLSFKTAGIEAIKMMAQKYPSYSNGVLQDPRERRSLTKEVENDWEIPIEQKAIIQSKVNRGIPLEQNLN